ncbi:hypothetical protein [Streptomyces sp. NPDC002540]
MPGKVADFLRDTELDDAERAALDHGQAVRRGTGYTLRVTAVPQSAANSSLAARHSTAPPRSRPNARPGVSADVL